MTNALKYPGFLGINQKLPVNARFTKDGAFLQDAENVFVRPDGSLKTRRAYDKVISISRPHSLWENFFAADGLLYRIDYSAGVFSTTLLLSDLAKHAHVSFTRHNGYACCSDGREIWKIRDSAVDLFGVPSPTSVPEVTVVDNGTLSKGWYSICVTHTNNEGEQSGASRTVAVEVTSDLSALSITGIPQLPGYSTQLYVSGANGTALYLVNADVGASEYVRSVASSTAVLETELLTRLPAGAYLASCGGRLFSASGNYLYYTEPYSSLHNPISGFIPFPTEITMVASCVNGLFVASGHTYWVNFEADGPRMRDVLPFGAVPYSHGALRSSNDVFWMTEYGIAVGGSDGNVKLLQKDKLLPARYVVGAGTHFEDGDADYIIESVSRGTSTVGASTSFDIEIVQ